MNSTRSDVRSGDRAGLVILSVFTGLIALAGIVSGGTLLGAHAKHRDADGFYATGTKRLATPTNALVSDDLDLEADGAGWLFRDGRAGTVRITATGTGSKPIFIGIAPRARVTPYLHAVAHDEISDFEIDPFIVTTSHRPGSRTPAAPTSQGFWSKSATGAGKLAVTWPMRSGTWEVVVMNADGTPSVRTDLTLGAKVPAVFWLGASLLAIGIVLALGFLSLIYRGSRRNRAA